MHLNALCFAKFPWQPLPCLAPLMLREAQHCLSRCQVMSSAMARSLPRLSRHVWKKMKHFETAWSYLPPSCLAFNSINSRKSSTVTRCHKMSQGSAKRCKLIGNSLETHWKLAIPGQLGMSHKVFTPGAPAGPALLLRARLSCQNFAIEHPKYSCSFTLLS